VASWHYASLYPVVFPGVSAITLTVLGFSQDNAMLSNLLWLLILLLATYIISSRLFDRKTGILSLVFLSFLPGVIAATRGFTKELALTAVITISLAFLLYSRSFQSRRHSILFGVGMATAALTYPSFILFFIGPLAVTGWKAIRNPESTKNLLLAGIIVILFASPWYLLHAGDYLDWQELVLDTPGGPRVSIIWALGRHLTVPILLLLIAAMMIQRNRGNLFLLSWLFFPLVFFALLDSNPGFHVIRFFFSVLPACAILLASFVRECVGRFGGRKLLATTIVFLTLAGMSLTLVQTYVLDTTLLGPLRKPIDPSLLNKGIRISPVRIKAEIPPAVSLLVDEVSERERTVVFAINHYGYISDMILTELAVRETLAGEEWYTLRTCIDQNTTHVAWAESNSCKERIDSADFLIIEGPGGSYLDDQVIHDWDMSSAYEHIQNANYELLMEVPNADLDGYVSLPAADFTAGRALILRKKTDLAP